MKSNPLLIVILLLLVVNLLASFGIVGSGKTGGSQYAVYSSLEFGNILVNAIAEKRGVKEGSPMTFKDPSEARYEGLPLALDKFAKEGWDYLGSTPDGLHIFRGAKGAKAPFHVAAAPAAPAAAAPAGAPGAAPAAPSSPQ